MRVTCEWGLNALEDAGRSQAAVIIVDVLSFSTAVDVAVGRGAAIYPYSGDYDGLGTFAAAVGAEAGGRRGESMYSLSPASLAGLAPGTAVALRSVNGGAISEAATAPLTLTGCLRNARAVALAASSAQAVALVPAGERWADGSLRPCIEDWLGAGSIAHWLAGERSAEAELAARAFESARGELGTLLLESRSGQELVDGGFAGDVHLAAELDVSDTVPVLREGAYILFGA